MVTSPTQETKGQDKWHSLEADVMQEIKIRENVQRGSSTAERMS